ncbi:MAG TPA: lipocalin family protein [Ferruginibacter sp.]|nr:lipocalin family protein [Ferruginibacter sp.]HRO17258.1 lipocalin family protein [Ferruginibacter sp.]HRQ20836.1 lipocalin family protein [Ferruginibacter sp.]
MKIILSLLLLTAVCLFWLTACTGIPKGAKPVGNFQVDRYLGTWYEIARLNHSFEKNLMQVTAVYTLNKNGTLKVVNSGYDIKKKKRKEAVGKAKFVGDKNVGQLKVSFFGPFYGSYNIIALDENYQYALVVGKDLSYLWILSRTTSLPDNVRNEYLQTASGLGYDTTALIWVDHNP